MMEYVEAMALSGGWDAVCQQTLRCEIDRFENFDIASTTAEVSRQCLLDLLAGRRRVGAQQCQRRQQHAGCTIAPLGGPKLAKGVLQRVQRTAQGHAFDSDNL